MGIIALLLRNIEVKNGLCNGTRLKITDLRDTIVCCDALTGPARGKNIALHLSKFRFSVSYIYIDFEIFFFSFEHHDAWKNLHFRRLQFPIRIGYALTIQKVSSCAI